MTTTILGLDGADWQIIAPLLERNELPVINGLIQNGCYGTLVSTMPPNSPPAWASMITGVNPGKHNIFDFTCIDAAYRKVPIEAMSRIAALPLWQILNRFGRTTGVVNLPIHYPAEHVNGFVICGLVTPWSAEVFTYPPDISHEIGSPSQNWLIGQTLVQGGSPEEFLSEIRHKTRAQADWILHLQKEYHPDFLMAVFDGTDKIQHFFWKYWDETHSRHDPMSSDLLKQAIPEYYRYIDNCLGEIIQERGDGDIFVVSDHGFTGMDRDVFIENWLLQNGYLNLKTPPPSPANVRYEKTSRSLWNTLAGNKTLKSILKRNSVSNWMIEKLKNRVQQTTKNSELNQYVDWSSTKVFFAGVSSQSLQVNRKGREVFGIVEAEDYQALVREVISRLKSIHDPENGKYVIKTAYEKGEIYHGDWTVNSPDVIIVSEDGYSLQEGFPDHLVAMSHLYGMDRSGGHRPEGIYIACGPNIRWRETPLDAQITDIMPTVLYLNGIPVPDYVDGRVLSEVISEDYLRSHIMNRTDQIQLTQTPSVEMTPEEKEMLESHLRALGYF